MRNIKDYQQLNEAIRKSLLKDGKPITYDKKAVNGANREIKLNNKCIEALQQGLTEPVLTKQLAQLKDKLKLVDSKFREWEENTPNTWKGNNLNHYNTLNNRSTTTRQISFLEYILS